MVLRCLQDYLLGKRQPLDIGRLPGARIRAARWTRSSACSRARFDALRWRRTIRAVNPKASERIVVGMSGGVDSAVSALLLKRAGFDVHGLYMSNWEDDDSYCTGAQDFQDARAVAAELGIPLHRVSFAEQYRARVFDYFLTEYRAGRTPNPDVLCNREIKFGICLDYAARLGAQRFATGHYARLDTAARGPGAAQGARSGQGPVLLPARRGARAFRARRVSARRTHKAEVRELAREAGLPVFDKPDSTGICFIGERPFREFLARYIPTTPGDIVTERGDGRRAPPGPRVLHAGAARWPRNRWPCRPTRRRLVRRGQESRAQ